LRVLTVVCPSDHRLLDVYSIGGRLLWIGSQLGTVVGRWPDGQVGKVESRAVRHPAGILDDPVAHLSGMAPVGRCSCGDFGFDSEWLIAEARLEFAPGKSRRVVPPWLPDRLR